MDTTPYWLEKDARPDFPPLSQDVEVDILIIGAGITGISCAELLSKSEKRVALVDMGGIGSGETSHTTAHLTYMTDTRISDVASVCGKEQARLAWQAGKIAMEHIQATAREYGIMGIAEVPGYLVATRDGDTAKETKSLQEELELIRELGFDAEWTGAVPPTGAPAIRFPGQMRFHPMEYISALAKAAAERGVKIFCNTSVDEFPESPTPHVIANGHRISFQKVIIATHVPLQGRAGTVGAAMFQTKLASYSTYAIAAEYPEGTLPDVLWSDTADPFNYLRLDRQDGKDIVIFGGEDHKTGHAEDTEQCFRALRERLESYLGKGTVTHQWSGQVVETVDGLPYIGEVVEDQFIATGFSGNGITFGVVAALMANDWVLGIGNPFEKVFSPSRVHVSSALTYVSENKDFPYQLLKDRFLPKGEPENILPGEGTTVKTKEGVLAICREADGRAHRLSAICPHMGCVVAWNAAEQTWDCPCHGSRFSAAGELIAGPAEEPPARISSKS